MMRAAARLSPSVLMAVLLLCPAALFGGERKEKGKVEFVSPWPGSVILDTPVVVAGRLPAGTRQVSFLHNGKLLKGVRRGEHGFSLTLSPTRVVNEVEVRADGRSARLIFVFGMKAEGQNPYAYHRPLLEDSCTPCHAEGGGGEGLPDAALCYQCHRALALIHPYVHGPVAAGKCLYCHDPHGSSHPSLARSATKALCLSCHDQLSSAAHTFSRPKECILCHDPHYSMRRFLLKGDF